MKKYYHLILVTLIIGFSFGFAEKVQGSCTPTVQSGSQSPTLCANTLLTPIVWVANGTTTSISCTTLPAGLTFTPVVDNTGSTGTGTISGTPSVSGSFTYTITFNGGGGGGNCQTTSTGSNVVTGTITVTAAPTAVAGTAISTCSTSGAVNITAGSSATNNAGTTWTSNGTGTFTNPTSLTTCTYAPSAADITAGSVTLTLTATGNGSCTNATSTKTLTINQPPTAAAGGSQTICQNGTATVSGATSANGTILWTENGAGSITAGPTTLTPTYTAAAGDAGNTVTLTMTVSNSGCTAATATYSVIVNPLPTASAGGSQTICQTGTATVSGASATNGTILWSENGAGSITSGATSLTPTYTAAAGDAGNTVTLTMTVTSNNACSPATATATYSVIVKANNTVGGASSTPTLCINTALTNITHATTVASGIGVATGLPAGVNANWASNTITISGTPTVSGTFNYSIPLSGGCGPVLNATGTLTVNPANTVSVGSSTPTLCLNTVLTNITHTTAGATGIGASSGLPSGVTASFASNTITISGTPTASGTFNYSIPLTGGCGSVSATGTITVTPNNTAGVASSTPTLCNNTVLTNITHTTTGATGIGPASGLPAGVSAAWAGNIITISGTPTTSGTFNYSIPLTGGCGSVSATGTITVKTDNTVSGASSTPTLCINTTLTNIIHTTSVATGIGVATGLPSGINANWFSNTITLSGTPTASGTFNYSIPLTGGCGPTINATGTITVDPSPTLSNDALSSPICSGGSTTALTLSSGVTGTSFSWVASTSSGISGFTPNGTTTIPLQTLTNPNNTAGTVTYTVTSSASTCVLNTTYTVTVNPTPSISLQSATTCSNSNFTISPSGSGNIIPLGTTYTWTSPNVTGGMTGGSAQVTGQANISQNLSNPTNLQQTASYVVTPKSGSAGSCVGSTFNATVFVNPIPTIPAQSTSICSGSAFTITPSNGGSTIVPSGTTYTWTSPSVTGGITGGSAQGAAQGVISQTLTNPSNSSQTATYTVTPTSGTSGNCVGSTFTIIVTVDPKPVIPNQTSTPICSGNAFTVSPTNGGATIVPTGTTYTWSNPTVTGGITGGIAQGTAQPNISQILTNPTNSSQTATYTVTPTSGTSGNCVGVTFTASVTVNPTPSVVNQTATTCSGIAFAVNPTNGGANIVPSGTIYSWTTPTVTGGMTGGSAASNQSSISQTLTNPTNTSQTATYTVTPNSGCNGGTFTVVVTVNPTPVVPNQTATICSGNTFTVGPSNGGTTIVPSGTTYSWTNPAVTGGVTGGSAQVGQTTISQLLNNPTNIQRTATYTVTPNAGCNGNTFTLVVTVNATPVIPTQTTTICSLTSFSISPSNGNPTAATIVTANTTYTWTTPNVTGGITGGSAQSGQTTIGQLLSNPNNITETATYTVTPTSGATGNCPGSTFTITVTVNPTPVIPAQASTICSLTSFTISPFNGNPTSATIVPANTTYSWTIPTVTGGITGGTTGTGLTNVSNLLNNPNNTTETATYTVTPISGSAGSCVGSTFTASVTVNPTPVIPAQTSSICSMTSFTVSPINSQPTTIVPTNTSYGWVLPTVTGGITGATSAAGSATITDLLNNPTNTSQTATYTVTPTSGAAGSCIGSTFTLIVTLNPTPVIPSQTSVICSLTSFTVSPANAQPNTIVPINTTYSWPAATVTGGITGGTALLTQSAVHELLDNPTNTTQNATYTVTPTSGASGGCVGSTFITTITVNPTPVLPPQTSTICSLSPFNIQPSNAQPTTIIPMNTTYTWVIPTVTGGITGGSAQIGMSQISDLLNNPTNTSQTATYNVLPTSGDAGSCVGSTFNVVVTVNPTPEIPNQLSTICSLTSFNVLPVNGIPTAGTIVPGGTTYSWGIPVVNSITGGSSLTNQSQISQLLTNPTDTTETAIYTVIPTSGAAGSCVGSAFTTTITVNPTPVIPPQTAAICSLTSFSIQPSNGVPSSSTIVPAGTTYSWIAPNVITITGGSTQSNQSPISQTLYNHSNIAENAVYNVVPTSGAAGSCVGASFTTTITVNPTPVIPSQTATICSGTSFNVSPQNTGTTIVPSPTEYTWNVQNPTIHVLNDTLESAQQSSISQLLGNDTSIVQTTTYIVTPTSLYAGGCVGATFTTTVTVNPTPLINDTVRTICSGTAFNVNPINNPIATIRPAGTMFTWSLPTLTGGITGSSAQGTGQTIISQTLGNPTNVPQTATYIVTPATVSCTGSAFTIFVTVNPTPVIPSPIDSTVCSGVAFVVNPSNNPPSTIEPAGTVYTWTYAGNNLVGGGNGQHADYISQTLSDSTFSNHTIAASYLVTPTAGSCTGSTFTLTITINPKPPTPIVTDNSSNIGIVDINLCGGSTNMSFNVNNSASGLSYLWSVSSLSSVIGNPTSPNTVITFGDSTLAYVDTVKIIATNTDGCSNDSTSFNIQVQAGNDIVEQEIKPMAPNYLWYEDNSNAINGYQWGVDSLGGATFKPIVLIGKIYQVLVPSPNAFYLKNDTLNTNEYWFWVTAYQIHGSDTCKSKIYYNGPYKIGHPIKPDLIPENISADILPNPNDGFFNLAIKGNIFGILQVRVINMLGQLVYESDVDKEIGIENYSLNLSSLDKGLYMIEINGMYKERILTKLNISK